MRIPTILIFLLVFSSELSSQIKIVKEYSNISEIKPDAIFMEINENEKSIENRNESLDSMRLALRNFDCTILLSFLSTGLQTEIDTLKKVLEEYSDHFNSDGEVYFKDRITQGYDRTKTTGYVRFTNSNDSIGSLELMCIYKGERPKIYEILIIRSRGNVEYEFPLIFSEIKEAKEIIQLQSEIKNYDIVIKNYKKLIERTSKIEGYYDNPNYGLTEKSNFYGNLAWYYALTNNPILVIENAKKGLEIWSYNYWINSNLVLGYVLNSDFEKASEIYSEMGSQYYKDGKFFKEIFISDLNRLKSENIDIPFYSRYLELLKEM